MDVFSIEYIFFEIWGYPMSYVEFFGTIAGMIAVWLSARSNVWGWPIGLINVILFFIIFFQVQLYPDMLLQVFFFVTNLMGWWRWTHPAPAESDNKQELKISFLPMRLWPFIVFIGGMGTLAMGYLATYIHSWFPILFREPAAFPYLDSLVTVMSIVATFMMIHKKIECWLIWIAIDIIASGMYFTKNIKLIGIEYIAFTIMALFGFIHWLNIYRSYTPSAISISQGTHGKIVITHKK